MVAASSPSTTPKACSRHNGSTSIGRAPAAACAVANARCRSLATTTSNGSLARRHARRSACARPAALSGTSIWPWKRCWRFQSVSPCRMTINSVMMFSIVRSIDARTVTTVILLPGLACDEALWRDQLPALRDRGHRVAVCNVHQRHATLPEMARALLAEHDGPLVLVGSSMGGMLAQHAHRSAPQRIAALALLSTTARPDTPELLRLRSDAIVEFEAGRAETVLRANAMFAFHPDHTDRARVDDYVQQILRIGTEQLIAQNRAVM